MLGPPTNVPVLLAALPGAAAEIARTALGEAGFEVVHASAPGLLAGAQEAAAVVVVAQRGDLRRGARIRAMRRAAGERPLVVAVHGASRTAVRDALMLGADGCVDAAGGACVPAAVSAALCGLVCVPRDARRIPTAAPLSHREREVLACVCRGMTNAQIAADLYLSQATVKSHLASSFRKLGVGSRAEAASAIARRAWVGRAG